MKPKVSKTKKKSKYDITVKTPDGMTFEKLLKLVTTPIKNSKVKKKKLNEPN